MFEPHFEIKPDNSHQAKNESEERAIQRQADADNGDTVSKAYELIEERLNNGEKLAVLFGDKSSPYIRIDPYFMQDAELSTEAEDALNALIDAIEHSLYDVNLKAGELAIFDNYKVVHGRRSFSPRYDGTDRWYKRINITRDLRKSRHVRSATNCRIVY